MLSLGDRTARELARGTLDQVLIKGEKGYVLMVQPAPTPCFHRHGQTECQAGSGFLDVRRAADAIGRILG